MIQRLSPAAHAATTWPTHHCIFLRSPYTLSTDKQPLVELLPPAIRDLELNEHLKVLKKRNDFAELIFKAYREHYIEMKIFDKDRNVRIRYLTPFETLENFIIGYGEKGSRSGAPSRKKLQAIVDGILFLRAVDSVMLTDPEIKIQPKFSSLRESTSEVYRHVCEYFARRDVDIDSTDDSEIAYYLAKYVDYLEYLQNLCVAHRMLTYKQPGVKNRSMRHPKPMTYALILYFFVNNFEIEKFLRMEIHDFLAMNALSMIFYMNHQYFVSKLKAPFYNPLVVVYFLVRIMYESKQGMTFYFEIVIHLMKQFHERLRSKKYEISSTTEKMLLYSSGEFSNDPMEDAEFKRYIKLCKKKMKRDYKAVFPEFEFECEPRHHLLSPKRDDYPQKCNSKSTNMLNKMKKW